VRLYFKENDLHILAKIRGVRSLRLQQVIRCKDGGFLEDRRDVLPVPDLRAKKMAGISRSFSIPEPYPNQLTDRHVPQTDKDQMGRRVEKGPPEDADFVHHPLQGGRESDAYPLTCGSSITQRCPFLLRRSLRVEGNEEA
jgi:hypothetical protein